MSARLTTLHTTRPSWRLRRAIQQTTRSIVGLSSATPAKSPPTCELLDDPAFLEPHPLGRPAKKLGFLARALYGDDLFVLSPADLASADEVETHLTITTRSYDLLRAAEWLFFGVASLLSSTMNRIDEAYAAKRARRRRSHRTIRLPGKGRGLLARRSDIGW